MLESLSLPGAKPGWVAEPAHFVSAAACRQVLSWREAADRLRAAYSAPHPEDASPRRVIAKGPGRALRVMAAAPPHSNLMGAKLFGYGGQKRTNYAILLVDHDSGEVRALVDGAVITAVRTSVTSALAVDRLAPKSATRLAVLGSGLEAQSHITAIAALRPIESLTVFSPTEANREALAAEATRLLGIPATACVTAQAAVEGADIVVAAARSRNEAPILMGDWLAERTVVVSVGSTVPDQREIDVSVVAACDLIVCDAVDEVVEETGDMLAARAAGVPFEDRIVSLNQLLMGQCDAAVATARRPLFKSVGNGMQDVTVAELAFDKALAAGLTLPLPLGFYTKG